jgi:hypothetical protein
VAAGRACPFAERNSRKKKSVAHRMQLESLEDLFCTRMIEALQPENRLKSREIMRTGWIPSHSISKASPRILNHSLSFRDFSGCLD